MEAFSDFLRNGVSAFTGGGDPSAANYFTALVGNGTLTAYTLNHAFGTRDVEVTVYENAPPYPQVLIQIERPDLNNVRLVFDTAPALNAYRAVVWNLAAGVTGGGDIADDSITNAKLRNSAALSVIGNNTDAPRDPADIGAGQDGYVLRRAGQALGFGPIATAGIGDDQVTGTKLRNSTAHSVIGRSGITDGDPVDIVAGTTGQTGANGRVLRMSGVPGASGATLAFGQVSTLGIEDDAVTNAKFRKSGPVSVVGRAGGTVGTTGDVADISAGTDGHILTRVNGALTFAPPAGTPAGSNYYTAVFGDDLNTTFDFNHGWNTRDVDVTVYQVASPYSEIIVQTNHWTPSIVRLVFDTPPTSGQYRIVILNLAAGVTTASGIDENAVTNTKLRDSLATSVIGRSAGTAGDPADIQATADGQVLSRVNGALTFAAPEATSIADNSITTAKVADNAITNAKLANMLSYRIKGRISDGALDPEDLTPLEARTVIGAATAVHSHAIADLPVAASGASNTTQVVRADDTRLSNARAPTAHTHAIADLPVATSGVSNTTSVVRADDSRLSDARVPTAHSHAIADLPVATSGTSNTTQVVRADDARLSDVRTPADNSVSNLKLRDSAGASVIGRAASDEGDPADIIALTDGHVLTRVAGGLTFAAPAAPTVADDSITDLKLRNSAALSVIGRSADTIGDPADIIAGVDGHALRRSGTAIGFGTIGAAGITNNSITDVKLRDGAAASVIGRAGNTSGDPADIVATQDGQILTRVAGALTFAAPATHTHTIADTTGLQTALDGKAATSHTHAPANISFAAGARLLGRQSGAGAGEELTAAQASVLLGAFRVLAHSAVAVLHNPGDTAEAVLATVNIPAGTMGANGILRITFFWSYPNNGNTKTFRVRLGGLTGSILATKAATTTTNDRTQVQIANRGAQNSQISYPTSHTAGGWSTNAGTATTTAVNTALSQDLVFTGALGVTTDTLTLEYYLVELLSAV